MLIVVDGGATHCRLAAFDDTEQRVAECRIERAASLSVDVQSSVNIVSDGIGMLEQRLGASLDDVPLICGLAGSLRDSLRAEFIQGFLDQRRVDVITDGHAQLLGATGGRPGACLAVGTGSVLHWMDRRGEFGMAGGWGYPAGDEASAAWLGLRLLQGYVRLVDSRNAPTPFWLDVRTRVGESVDKIQEWTTCKSSSDVGSLAVLVSRHAQLGDSFCLSLVEAGADECEQLMVFAPPGLPMCMQGGLSETYKPVLESRGHVFEDSWGDALDGLRLHAQAGGVA